jgi:hypothetical protein
MITRAQTGVVHTYSAFMAAGLVVVGGWYMTPHARLQVALSDDPLSTGPVDLVATAGLGYQYRWDFDSDGHYDTDWLSNPVMSHQYTDERPEPGPAVLIRRAGDTAIWSSARLSPGELMAFESRHFGAWQRDPSELRARFPALIGAPPRIVADPPGVVIRPNGALVWWQHQLAHPMQPVRVDPGESVRIGDAELFVAGAVRASVTVRNAFGVECQDSVMVTVPKLTSRRVTRALGGGGR